MQIRLNAKDALIVVDIQVDFLPGGALAVAGADKIIPQLNRYIEVFSQAGLPVYFTRDWHPRQHLSFVENGGSWPRHCEADTPGASFPPELLLPADNKYIVSKGARSEIGAYSGFQDTPLLALLQERGIHRVFIGGVAAEYCVKSTAQGAINLGFSAVMLTDAIQGIDRNPGDGERVLEELLFAGAFAVTFKDCCEV